MRFVEVFGEPRTSRGSGARLADLVAERGGHPSDVLADFVLANDCRPGVVAVGIANADIDGVARTLADPDVLISSSDAGAHVQMLCASGDTTLLFTRHVRERGDLTLEQAVYELTGRQADVFGFNGRGVVAPRATSPISPCSRSTSCTTTTTSSSTTCPAAAHACAAPEGGYRATVVDGVPVQLDGELTGALPGRMLSSAG